MGKPYIIAEVGSNFTTFDDAKDAIPLAKACGADAVKFQCFTSKEMYGFEGERDLDIREWLPHLKEKADACDIDFLCTAFSPETLKLVDKLGVKAHKIASSDLSYIDLLKAAKETGKHVYLSVGGHHWNDIRSALEYMGKTNTTVMYCCSEYPSRWHNLRAINVIRDTYNCNAGYSDHSIDVYTPVTAYHKHGATVIEKHFNPKPEVNTPDSGHSLCPDSFAYMCAMLRNGDEPIKYPSPGERDMLLRHNRRLIVTQNINTGDALQYGRNFGSYRSLKDDTRGLGTWYAYKVDGKRAAKGMNAGDSIGPGDYA